MTKENSGADKPATDAGQAAATEEPAVPPIVRLAAVEKMMVAVAASALRSQGIQPYQVRALAQESYDAAGNATDEFDRQVLQRLGDGWADVADRMSPQDGG